jgi:hypothetical protein
MAWSISICDLYGTKAEGLIRKVNHVHGYPHHIQRIYINIYICTAYIYICSCSCICMFMCIICILFIIFMFMCQFHFQAVLIVQLHQSLGPKEQQKLMLQLLQEATNTTNTTAFFWISESCRELYLLITYRILQIYIHSYIHTFIHCIKLDINYIATLCTLDTL